MGDTVEIQRAGDVIPQILRVIKDGGGDRFVFPTKCPICKTEASHDIDEKTGKKDVVRRCTNGMKCPAQAIEKLKHFVSRRAFDIDGLGAKQIELFYNKKWLDEPSKIFELDYTKISKLDGFGEISSNNLKYAIDDRKNIDFDRFLYALGIRHIGQGNANLISKHYLKWERFINQLKLASKHRPYYLRLISVDGVGPIITESLFCLLYTSDAADE